MKTIRPAGTNARAAQALTVESNAESAGALSPQAFPMCLEGHGAQRGRGLRLRGRMQSDYIGGSLSTSRQLWGRF